MNAALETPPVSPSLTRRRRTFLAPLWLLALGGLAVLAMAFFYWRSATTTTIVLVRHVKVRGRTISNPVFEINGKRMKKTAMRHVPKDIRACLEESKKSAESSERRQIAFTGPIQQLRMYSPRTDVRFTGRCTVKASCNQNVCCALATCGREQAVECVGF